jgi:hypothetical protein
MSARPGCSPHLDHAAAPALHGNGDELLVHDRIEELFAVENGAVRQRAVLEETFEVAEPDHGLTVSNLGTDAPAGHIDFRSNGRFSAEFGIGAETAAPDKLGERRLCGLCIRFAGNRWTEGGPEGVFRDAVGAWCCPPADARPRRTPRERPLRCATASS